jgi:hypothetical protein
MSRLLLAIRGGRLQDDAARLVGLTQPKVSRLERGIGPPLTPAEADDYARALGATDEQRSRLVELAEVKTASHVTSRRVLVRSAAAIQARIRDLEESSTVLRTWVPDAIPGVLQTRAYTEAMLAGDGEGDPGPDWWAARMARVALLDDPAREWHEIVSEAALRWVLGSPAATVAQIEHIIGLSRRDHVHISVVDLATPKPFLAPQAFHIYESPDGVTAEVATDVGTVFVDDPAEVGHFRRQFEQLHENALHGDDARRFLARTADEILTAAADENDS